MVSLRTIVGYSLVLGFPFGLLDALLLGIQYQLLPQAQLYCTVDPKRKATQSKNMMSSSKSTLLLMALLVAGGVNSQFLNFIPQDLLDQIPDACEATLDMSVTCVIGNLGQCLGPLTGLLSQVMIPEAPGCDELVDLSCMFYAACPPCESSFTTFIDCIETEYNNELEDYTYEVCEYYNMTNTTTNMTDTNSTSVEMDTNSTSVEMDSNSTAMDGNMTNSTMIDTNSTGMDDMMMSCTNVTVTAAEQAISCTFGAGLC